MGLEAVGNRLDRRRAWRDWEHWRADGHCRDKHDPSLQWHWVRIGVSDSTRGRPGASSLYGHGSGSASVTVRDAGRGLEALTTMGRGGQTGGEGTEGESKALVRCMMGHRSRLLANCHDRRRAWRDWEHQSVDGRCRDKHDHSLQWRGTLS